MERVMAASNPPDADDKARLPIALSAIEEAIAKLRYGTVVLTVHEGRLVQMDVTEKHRFS
jgi:hypothetical protein